MCGENARGSRTLTASLEGAIKAGARPRAFLAFGRVQHEMVQMDHDAITSVPQSIGWVKNPGRTSARVAGKIRTRVTPFFSALVQASSFGNIPPLTVACSTMLAMFCTSSQ